MNEYFLLATFCNQTESPRQSCALFDFDADGCSWLEQALPKILEPHCGGLCGACGVGDDLVLGTQSAAPSLILYDPVNAQVKATRDLPACRDLHSVVHHDGTIYAVSTGTNEIYEIPLGRNGFGTPRLYWRYPNVEDGSDVVHLNGLAASADGLIASCFGPKQPDGAWGCDGAVFRVDPFEIIQDGLSQPHTPLWSHNRLYFAESRAHLVHIVHRDERGNWHAERPIDVSGYARGLACQGDRLWVGISTPRRVSRSKGTRNLGIGADNGAELVCIDLNTCTVTERRPLGGLGNEIYDLVSLNSAAPVGRTVDALNRRIVGMRERIDTILADIPQRQQLQQQLQQQLELQLQLQAQQQANRQALHAERAYSDHLAQQLQIVAGSRLWQIADLLRRVIGRGPHVFELRRPPTGGETSFQ